jgi:hypothetical protein
MPQGPRIHLHDIDRSIRDVQAQLKSLRSGATAAEKKRLEALLKKLTALRAATARVCPQGFGIWPPRPAARAKTRPAGGRRKTGGKTGPR